jgi:hypothetical protein
VTRIPDKDEHRRKFAALPVSERRAIVKTVNRGRTVTRRKDAPLAVGVARQQQRFWRVAWLAGPAIGLIGLRQGVEVAIANALMGTLLMGLIAGFYTMRARRSEIANREVVAGKRRPGDDTRAVQDPRTRRKDKAAGKDATKPSKPDKGSGKSGSAKGSTKSGRKGHLPKR